MTFKAIVLTFIGSKRKEVTAKKFNEVQKFGSGKGKFTFQSASKFVQLLIAKDILQENIPSAIESTSTATLSVGSKANVLLNDEISLSDWSKDLRVGI